MGDIDGFSLAGTDRCELSGERFRWVLRVGTNTPADGEEAWAAFRGGAAGYAVQKVDASTTCAVHVVKGTGAPAFEDVYTPKGTSLNNAWTPAVGTGANSVAAGFASAPTWKKANASLTALSWRHHRAAAVQRLGHPGARGSHRLPGLLRRPLYRQQHRRRRAVSIAIGATVIVVLAGAILPEVFEPLDKLYLSLDGQRFWVYSVGIGKLGPIIGNFMGIALLGGIVTLGMLLWKGHSGQGRMSQAM